MFGWVAVVNVPDIVTKEPEIAWIIPWAPLALILPEAVILPVIVWVSEAALPKTVFPVEFTASNVSM